MIDFWIKLLSFHSPLLRKSMFVSVPLPSNMFKFGRFSYMKLTTTVPIYGKIHHRISNSSEEYLRSMAQIVQHVKKTAMYISSNMVYTRAQLFHSSLFQHVSMSDKAILNCNKRGNSKQTYTSPENFGKTIKFLNCVRLNIKKSISYVV